VQNAKRDVDYLSTEVVDGCLRDCGLCLRVAQKGHEDSGDKRGEPEGGEK